MNRKIFLFIGIFLLLSALIFCAEKTLFSNGWYFTRLNSLPLNKKTGQSVQTGKSWETQFNIETVNTKRDEKGTPKLSKKEIDFLKTAKWEKVNLPHTAYIEPLVVKIPWQGIAYYRKKFFVNASDKKKLLFLHFEGVMQVADIWINGKFALRHSGGYTPFEILLNPYLKFGKTNEILVRADNRDNPLVPPGKPVGKLDFNYYSGIYRDVWLIKREKVHIPDPNYANIPAAGGVFVRFPYVSKNKAIVLVKTTVKNSNKKDIFLFVKQILKDNKGKIVKRINKKIMVSGGRTKIIRQKIMVLSPHLWDIEEPYLYTLETVLEGKDKTYDFIKTKIGIRKIEFTRDKGFLLNGKPLKLVGCNRHQEYPYIGNALSDNAQYRDMYKIKNGGFNIVRLGHYPQDPSVLDACDELGLLVIEPIPGWQFFNENKIFVKRTFRDIRDMIRRDRNHPSVVMWETVLNESRLPIWWKKEAYKVAHQEYPGNQCYTSGDMYGTYVWDVLYNDWHEGFTRPNNSKKPGFIREYGDYEFGGDKSTTRQRRGAGEKALLQSAWNFQWSFNRYNAYYPWTTGNAIWEMFDHNRGCCPTISASGASDIFRIPKFTYYFFKSQLNPGKKLAVGKMKPEVYIANYWMKGKKTRKVVVYGNVEKVALFVNGKKVAEKLPDNGPDTPYFYKGETPYEGGHPFDGGNCKNLSHPPFTFKNIKWERGEIKAVGYIKGKKSAGYSVKTPGKLNSLKIDIDFSGRKPKAGKKDVLFVYVKLIDKNGILCVYDNETNVYLKVKGAKILSPSTVKSEAGIATFLISTFEKGEVNLKAFTKKGLTAYESFVVD